MYALSFDMVISDLQKYYGEPYNKAYFEIKELLTANGFEWVQGSTYLTKADDLTAIVKTVMQLSKIDWFKKSVRDTIKATILEEAKTKYNISKEESIEDIIAKLTDEMLNYARNMEFEKAAELRDKIKELENMMD